MNQDEFLPLLPMSHFTKEPEARSSLLEAYSRPIAGVQLPVQSYPYEGAVTAYLFLATGLPPTVLGLRIFNLVGLGSAFALVLIACWRLSNGDRTATLVCLGLLLADVSLVVLQIAGLSRGDLLLGAALMVLFIATIARPRWWAWMPIALLVFLGVWAKLSFIWFVGAGLAGCAAAACLGRAGHRLAGFGLAAAGSALGIAAVGWLVPTYAGQAAGAAVRNLSGLDLEQLWEHWRLLFGLLDPYSAYHRFVDVSGGSQAAVYVVYRWGVAVLYLATTLVAGTLACVARWRRRDHGAAARLAFVAGSLGTLLLLIVKTQEAWAAHHIAVLRPFLYLGLAALVAHLGSWRRPAVLGLLVLTVLSGAVGARGFRDLAKAPQIPGHYNVSWNAVDAWRAAGRSPVNTVYALDWGVFYPGVVNSPPTQRWEMATVPDPLALYGLRSKNPGEEIGLLFKSAGPHRWLMTADSEGTYRIVADKRFTAHPGEGWVFLVVNTARWVRSPAADLAREPGSNLLRNPRFVEGEAYWQHEIWEQRPGAVALSVAPCPAGAGRKACAELRHTAPGDSRFLQELALAPQRLYEVRALARTAGVDTDHVGAHLGLMEFYGHAESEKLVGDTDWRVLRFYVYCGDSPQRARFAARLGTYGSPNTGTAWFTDLVVREVSAPAPGVPVYDLDTRR